MSAKVHVWYASHISFSLMKWMPLVVLGLMIVLEAILFPLSYVADLDAAMFPLCPTARSERPHAVVRVSSLHHRD